MKRLLMFIFLASILLMSGCLVKSSGSSSNIVDSRTIDISSSYYEGKEDAPVTIVVFDDFQCPYCEKFFSGALPNIRSNYIDTGKVKFVFKHFPLSFHQYAEKAAEAAECAGEQGKFWEMHDKLYENQNALDIDSLKSYAADLGLNTEQFNQCLDSGKYADKVKADFDQGVELGVRGTPTFFVNNQQVIGAQPYNVFRTVIEQELNSAKN